MNASQFIESMGAIAEARKVAKGKADDRESLLMLATAVGIFFTSDSVTMTPESVRLFALASAFRERVETPKPAEPEVKPEPEDHAMLGGLGLRLTPEELAVYDAQMAGPLDAKWHAYRQMEAEQAALNAAHWKRREELHAAHAEAQFRALATVKGAEFPEEGPKRMPSPFTPVGRR